MNPLTLLPEIFYTVVRYLDEKTTTRCKVLNKRFHKFINANLTFPVNVITINHIYGTKTLVKTILKTTFTHKRVVIILSKDTKSEIQSNLYAFLRDIRQKLFVVDIFQTNRLLKTNIAEYAKMEDIPWAHNSRPFWGFGEVVTRAWEGREVHKRLQPVTYAGCSR